MATRCAKFEFSRCFEASFSDEFQGDVPMQKGPKIVPKVQNERVNTPRPDTKQNPTVELETPDLTLTAGPGTIVM